MLSKFLTKLLSSVFLLSLAFACRQSGENDGKASIPAAKDLSLTVSIAPLGRAAIAADKIVWEAGDSICVFDGYLTRIFRCSEGGASAVFSGKACPAESYGVAWPASSASAYAHGKYSVVIPDVQRAVLNSFPREAYPVYGVADAGEAVTLSPVAALAKIEIEPGNEALGQISVSSGPRELLTGRIIISTSGNNPPVVLGNSTRAVLLPEGDCFVPGTYYVALNPIETENGLDLKIESNYYAPFERHIPVATSLAKGEAISLGSFNPSDERVEEEPDDPAADPSSNFGFDFAKLRQKHHPRLFMTAEDFLRLKKMLFLEPETHATLVQLHNATMGYADQQLLKADELPLPEGTKNDVLTNVAREAVGRIFSLSYAYRLTGDTRYLASAKRNLARISSYTTWYPQSYLSTGELMLAAAVGYDWLYYELSLEERTAARQAMCTLGLQTVRDDHYATKADNWNQVCNAGLFSAALVSYEKAKTLCGYHIDASIAANLNVLDIIYGQDGSYPEGYGYWEYGTTFQSFLTEASLTAFGSAGGIETHRGLLNTGHYMLYMADAIGSFPYSDGGRSSASTRIAQWWLAGLCNDPSLLVNEVYMLAMGHYKSGGRTLPFVPCVLSKHPELASGPFNYPTERVWSGNGTVPMVLVRDGWNNDAGDVYLAMKGGPANTNHGHMDSGSFVYDRFGVRWIDEILLTGGYAPYENALEDVGGNFWGMGQGSLRWDVFVMNNLAHPTLSFENNDGSIGNKVHDTDHCVSGKATLQETISTATRAGGRFDMTPVFAGQVASATRQAVLDQNLDAEITDIITALPGQDAKLQWRVPTKVTVSVGDDCVELISSGKEMYLYTVSSDSALVPVFTDFGNTRPAAGLWGWQARSWDQGTSAYHIVGYTLTIPAGQTVTLRTMISTEAPGQVGGGAENESPEM